MRAMLANLCIAVTVASTLPVSAHGAPVGPRFQINQFVVGNQGSRMSCAYYERRSQDVAADPLGNFVVVWQSQDEDGYNSRILARRYNRFGLPEGHEFQVSPTTTGEQMHPAVTTDAAGDFVVVWNSYQYPGSYGSDIHARRFAANGSPKGPDFQVSGNGYTLTYGTYSYTLFHYSYIRNPDVHADSAGNFIVVWQRAGDDPAYMGDDDETQIAAHRFNSAGISQGGRFIVSDGSSQSFYFNGMPDVAHDADGNFVVVWKANDAVEFGEAVVGRRFDAAGSPLGGEFKVNTNTEYNFSEATPVVATDASGGFLVVWGSSSMQGDDSHYMDVAARKFDSGGTPLAPEFRVNTETAEYQCGPSVAHLADDGFVVTWHRPFAYAVGQAWGQLLDDDGTAVGGEFVLDPVDYATSPVVAAQQGSDFVVVWADAEDGPDGHDVFGQRFGTTELPACSPVPLTTCREPIRSGGVFKFRRRSDPSSSRLTWKWVKGELTDRADFGDPLTDTSVLFCVYDASAAPQPLATLTALPGGFCGLAPCWNQLGSSVGPLLFLSAHGNASGITQIRLTPGAEGKVRISVTAEGENLSLPATSLAAPVIVQAQASNGECWTAHYDSRIRKNEPGEFTAKPSVP